jgi:hypothetical protein
MEVSPDPRLSKLVKTTFAVEAGPDVVDSAVALVEYRGVVLVLL